jgi:hypothetical protein
VTPQARKNVKRENARPRASETGPLWNLFPSQRTIDGPSAEWEHVSHAQAQTPHGDAAIEEQGRARLMLRMPQHRQALAGVSSDHFLDLCESYELACNALVHWSKSTCAEKAERMEELRAIVAEMELDAAHYAAVGSETRPPTR